MLKLGVREALMFVEDKQAPPPFCSIERRYFYIQYLKLEIWPNYIWVLITPLKLWRNEQSRFHYFGENVSRYLTFWHLNHNYHIFLINLTVYVFCNYITGGGENDSWPFKARTVPSFVQPPDAILPSICGWTMRFPHRFTQPSHDGWTNAMRWIDYGHMASIRV